MAGGGGAGGGGGGGACTDPLPEMQVAVATTDSSLHTHMVVIGADVLDATTAQTFSTNTAGPAPGHMHMITLTPANLTALKGGGTVDVLSTNVSAHTHTYRIRCT
jgi:hypothetical protein